MESKSLGEKVGIVGDLHLGCKGGSIAFAEFQQNYIMEMLDYYHSIQVDIIIQLGDYVDIRRSITGELVHWLSNTFIPKLAEYGMTWIQLAGNHSQVRLSSNELTWDQLLEDLAVVYGNSCVKAITSPTDININGLDLCCLPWINPNTHDLTVEHIEKSEATICLGHFELSNMYLLKGALSKHETIDKKHLAKFEQTISGHYHTSSSSGNIFYTGTPYALNFGEWEEPAENGIYSLDTLTQKLEFIPNKPNQSMFTEINYNYQEIASSRKGKLWNDVDYLENELNLKDKIIRVIITDSSNKSHYAKFIKALRSVQCINYTIIDTTQSIELETEEVDANDFKVSPIEILLDKINTIEYSDCDADDKEIRYEAIGNKLKSVYNRCQEESNLV